MICPKCGKEFSEPIIEFHIARCGKDKKVEIVAPVPEYFKSIIESEEKKNGRNPITEIFG